MSLFTIKSRPSAYWMADLLSEVRRAALEFVYPPACLLCQANLDEDYRLAKSYPSLCDECVCKLVSGGNACRKCGAPVGPYSPVGDHCILCKRENYSFDEVIRLGLYRDDLRIACLKAKTPSGGLLGQSLADLMLDVKQASFTSQKFDLVMPVPEHWLKRMIRTQYAAETLARRISDRLKVRLATGILAKARWTPKQAKSLPAQRRQQQKEAFCVRGATVRNQAVLLVDDILTTGATADAAARELKRAGATRVVVAVMAVSPPRV